MPAEKKKITFDLFIRGVIGLCIGIGLLVLIDRLSGVLLPFFVAWLLAYLIFPMVKFFQYRCRLKYRVVAVSCSLLLIIGAGTGLFYLLVPPTLSELGRIKDLITEYLSASHTNGSVPAYINQYIQTHFSPQQIAVLFEREDFLNSLRNALPRVWAIVTESINLVFSVFSLLMILLYTIYILMDYENISEGWISLVPRRYRLWCRTLVSDLQDGMNKYFRGQAIVASCVGVLFTIGFLIIGFPMPIMLGLFIGLLNMVPYLQLVGFVPTIALAILQAYDTGGNFWIILLSALAVFAVVQTIQDGYLTPRIMGKVTGLSPAIILLSLSVFGSLMGILGMIIALPITTLLVAYYQRYVIDHEPGPWSR